MKGEESKVVVAEEVVAIVEPSGAIQLMDDDTTLDRLDNAQTQDDLLDVVEDILAVSDKLARD